MSRIRALIVDDEPLAREGIAIHLAHHADIEVVGESGNARDAIRAVSELQPDVVFLDIQMPGMTGLEMLRKLDTGAEPFVVFVTAHDRFAVDAFRAHALDYLLKPVDGDQVSEALTRLRLQLVDRRDGAAARRLRAFLTSGGLTANDPPNQTAFPDRLSIKEKGRTVVVNTDQVEYVEADGDYVRVHAGDHTYVVRDSLGDFSRQLDPSRFVRIHRSTIVNVRRIVELRPAAHGERLAITISGAQLKVTRTHSASLAHAIDENW